jgi:hypothetical protein
MRGPLSRVVQAVALIGTLALATAGCGIRSTGMSVFAATPVEVAQPPASPSNSASDQYPYTLYFIQNNTPVPVPRFADHQLTDLEIAAILQKGPTPAETAEGYQSRLPPYSLDITLSSQQAREYEVDPLFAALPIQGRFQITCTLDVYWKAHPVAGFRDSVRFVADGKTLYDWNDCSAFLDPASASSLAAEGGTKVPAPTAVPTTGR